MSVEPKSIVKTVFFALVLDLLAFTIPLPLFPRLTAWYLIKDSSPNSLLSRLLSLSRNWRSALLSLSDSAALGGGAAGLAAGEAGKKNWDIVLLGGAMGSLFSFCQCIISPWLGRLSDKYGRKKVLLATMMGNIISAIIWIQSTTFASFLLSRLVGGLSEGNVQLSTAIISDVTTSETRSKSLALVGIAFSICFTLGPSLGAYFASRPLPLAASTGTTATGSEDRLNIYSTPAIISLVLLLLETGYLFVALPETKDWKRTHGLGPRPQSQSPRANQNGLKGPDETGHNTTAANGSIQSNTLKQVMQDTKVVAQSGLSVEERLEKLKVVGRLHGLFLLFFSGAEFTLTFLTYDLFAASNAQNGRLLSYIGILSSLLQARHVRPSLARSGEIKVASRGIFTCLLALSLLSILPLASVLSSPRLATAVLYAAATCLAYTSATVVTGLTAAAASYTDEADVDTPTELDIASDLQSDKSSGSGSGSTLTLKRKASPKLARGRALGSFRSRGQLGRAIGPLLASSVYWIKGPTIAYASLAGCLGVVYVLAARQAGKKSGIKVD